MDVVKENKQIVDVGEDAEEKERWRRMIQQLIHILF